MSSREKTKALSSGLSLRKRKLRGKGKFKWVWDPKVKLIRIETGCAEGGLIYEFACEAKVRDE